MSTETQKPQDASVSVKEKPLEFVPFGSEDKVRLSINMVRNLIAVPTKTGKLPTDNDCTKFIMMCLARRLNPYEGDSFLIGYDTKDGPKFSMITAHQAFLKRAELNKEYNGMESGVMVMRNEQLLELPGDFMLPGDTLIGGWSKVHFKGRQFPMHKRVNLATFNKGTNQWLANPAGMIVKCAEADALRSAFPTMLGSLYIQEELSETATPRVATPIFKDKSAPVEAVVMLEPVVEDKWSKVLALAERDGIEEATLREWMEASNFQEADADKITAGWDEFSKFIRGVE